MAKSNEKQKKPAWLYGNRRRIAWGFERIILYEFDILEEHREFVEEHFARSLAKFKKHFDEEVAAVSDPEVRAAYEDHLSEQYRLLADDLPRLQWNAQFLMAYSVFEDSLHQLCRMVQRHTGHRLGFKDLEGQGITRASNYLKKVFRVEKPFQTTAWQRALLLAETRNAIAHRNGRVDLTDAKQAAFATKIQKLDGVEVKKHFKDADDGELVLTPVFLRDAIRTLRTVLTDVANYELEDDES